MRNLNNLFKKGFSGLIILVILLIVGTEIFQGQGTNFYDYDESDPLIDRPTSESMLHFVKGADESDIITDANGFDNFEIGIDNAEQMLVSNPRNPLNMQFGVNGGSGQNAYYTINGHDWTLSNPNYHPSTCCDPWSAWDSLGILHYGSGVSGQYVYNSTNGGQTYGAAILTVSGNDRNTMAADQTNGPFSNYLYAAITPGNFARSTNGGTTWAQTFTSSNAIPGVMIAVGPNGSIQGGCVMYVTNTGSTANVTYNFFRSTTGGTNFALRSNLTVAGYVGTLNTAGRLVINNGRTRPYPMIAMDNSYGSHRGRLYLVYASNVPPGNGNKPDIILQYSDDQGATWSSRITVNDNPNPQLSDQWFPAIWCVKETGRLYIKWYDTRESPATYGVHVYATYTDDGGQTFAPNQKLTTQSWTYPTPACAPNINCYRGDYDGMTANPKTSFSVWYDGRQGNYKNIGAYFPDFAMKVNPSVSSINYKSDSTFYYISVPAVKLYTDRAKFTASISPSPISGTIQLSFVNGRDSLTSYPDSVRLRVKTIGGVTTGNYTITVTGQGSNGTPVHKRTMTLIVNQSILITSLDLTTIIEGFYDTGTNKMRQKDTARVYLRNTSLPYSIVDSAKGIIDSLTFIGQFEFRAAPTGTYYIIVKHRNSIETWSNSGVAYTLGGSFSYNFTTAASQAFGSNLILKGTRYCMYSGDVNQDAIVDISDISMIYNDLVTSIIGYVSTDVNGDFIVDVDDLSITYNNAANSVSRIRP